MTTAPPQKIKVCLVDDHQMLRDSLAKTVNSFGECEVVLQASNGKKLIEALSATTEPDIVVLDIAMPEMDGYATAQWLCQHKTSIKVIVLTMFNSDNLTHLVKSGVRGFVKKDAHPDELKKAIHAVVEDGVYYSRSMNGRLFDLMKTQGQKDSLWGNVILTDIELVFLKHICTEMTYKQIADLMHVSPRTIDNYRDALFLKLDVKSRVGLAVFAVKNGIVSL